MGSNHILHLVFLTRIVKYLRRGWFWCLRYCYWSCLVLLILVGAEFLPRVKGSWNDGAGSYYFLLAFHSAEDLTEGMCQGVFAWHMEVFSGQAQPVGSAVAQKQLRSHSEPAQLSSTELSQISWLAQARLLDFCPAASLAWAAVETPWAFGCSMGNALSFALVSAGAGLKS